MVYAQEWKTKVAQQLVSLIGAIFVHVGIPSCKCCSNTWCYKLLEIALDRHTLFGVTDLPRDAALPLRYWVAPEGFQTSGTYRDVYRVHFDTSH